MSGTIFDTTSCMRHEIVVSIHDLQNAHQDSDLSVVVSFSLPFVCLTLAPVSGFGRLRDGRLRDLESSHRTRQRFTAPLTS